MNLSNFLTELATQNLKLHEYPVVCFQSESYPALFFSVLFRHPYFRNVVQSLPTLLVFEEIRKYAETTFLGMHSCYFIGSIDNAEKMNNRKLLAYLTTYQGPNTLIFFQNAGALKKCPASWLSITIDQNQNKKNSKELVAFFSQKEMSKSVQQFVDNLFVYSPTLSVDEAVLLAQYAIVCGKPEPKFYAEWLPKILVSESSLFTLSQNFFAKNHEKFFAQWVSIAEQYAATFWISFWSEQLFRGHIFAQQMKQGKRILAKKISYKLPFSFIQKDWRSYLNNELKNAHDYLYYTDYRLKHNESSHGLDVFFVKFFTNTFIETVQVE